MVIYTNPGYIEPTFGSDLMYLSFRKVIDMLNNESQGSFNGIIVNPARFKSEIVLFKDGLNEHLQREE